MRRLYALGFFLALTQIAVAAGDVELVIKTKLGDEVIGAAAIPSIRVKTAFGEATVLLDMLAAVDVGDPDLVSTHDGSKFEGKILTEKIVVKVDGKSRSIDLKEILKIRARVRTVPVPGEIVDGVVSNGLTYHLRAPKNYDPKTPRNAILILHGSNMNSKAYVDGIAGNWPNLAEDFILIGVNGEFRVKDSSDGSPAYNYTYVHFVGKSIYQDFDFPGSERESPALVSEAIVELKKTFSVKRFFVGGHSQGGFLTYSLLMSYPELIAGAFPVSGGVIFQCEPTAFDKADLRAAQRRVPLAIVHGENDTTVEYSMATYARQVFEDDGFPMVHLFTDKSAAHMFGMLPIDTAVRWLESLSKEDPTALLTFAEKCWNENDPRTAIAALQRAQSLDTAGNEVVWAAALVNRIEEAAAGDAEKYGATIQENKNGQWLDGFLAFRRQYEFAPCAKAAMVAFAKLRQQHQKPASELFAAAQADFQKQKRSDGYKKCQEIVDKYYASNKYATAKRWLAERK